VSFAVHIIRHCSAYYENSSWASQCILLGIAVHIIGLISAYYSQRYGLRTHLMKLSIHNAISVQLRPTPAISGHLRPSPPSSGHLRLSPAISGHLPQLRPSPAISAHLRPYPAISGQLRPSPPISGHVRPSTAISGHLRPFRPSPPSSVAVHIIGHCSAYYEYSCWALQCILSGIAVGGVRTS
jgi:hypothetical protein